MSQEEFPLETFLDTVVRLMDTVNYKDDIYTHAQRTSNLQYTYSKTAQHFAQPHVQDILRVPPKHMAAAVQTIARMVVYAWGRISKELMADLSIHYTYCLLLDDSMEEPGPSMQSWYEDLLAGRPQRSGWWRLVNDFMPNMLRHYGGYCKLNLVRSTVDFFQGCWVEEYNFKGFHGSHDYPGFLRRLNGLGHFVGASLWPKAEFEENELFLEITTSLAHIENWMVWVNDLFSCYKEFYAERDQTSLVNNYCETGGITINQALDKLCQDTIESSERLVSVFADKDPKMVDSIRTFVQGYITWHLCDDRYKLDEIYGRVGNSTSPTALKFMRYYEAARKVGKVAPEEFAVPSVTTLEEQARASFNAQELPVLPVTKRWDSRVFKAARVYGGVPVTFATCIFAVCIRALLFS